MGDLKKKKLTKATYHSLDCCILKSNLIMHNYAMDWKKMSNYFEKNIFGGRVNDADQNGPLTLLVQLYSSCDDTHI